jgi:hypothetical protein
LLTSALPWTALRAQTLSTAEFFGNTLNSARSLGTSVAITETLILAGRPAAFSTGEVLVLDARTGVQRRILRSPLPPGTPDDFGRSMAASGNLALIGAPDVGNRGAAYLMNPSTGALIQFLQPIALNPNDLLGMSVAMTGSFLVVGAPETADVAGLNQGAVYVFEARTGNLIHRLLAPDAAAGDRFGASVAVSGHYVAVGAPSKNAGAGRAYVFDARTGDSFRFPDPSALFAGDQYGTSVAISGSLLIAGAPGAGGGNGRVVVMDIPAAVELFSQNGGGSYGHRVAAHGRFFAVSSWSATSTRTRQGYVAVFESTLRTPGPVPFRLVAQCSHPFPTDDNEFLGSAIALNADTLVAGVPGRTHIAAAVGSVVRFGPFASQLDRFANPPGHHEVARSGDTTPDRAGSAFSGFTQLAAGPSSGLSSPRLVVDAALTGRRAGWCANTNLDGNLYTLNRTGDALTPGVNVIDFLNPITNVAERTVVRAMLRGPAVTAASNEAILLSIQRAPFPMVRKGDAVLGGQVSRLGQPRMGTAGFVTLNAKLNAAATADSGLYVYTTDGTFVACRIEGSAAPGLGAIPLGEFANRMATQSSFTAYTTALQTAPALNQAIFKDAGHRLWTGLQHVSR